MAKRAFFLTLLSALIALFALRTAQPAPAQEPTPPQPAPDFFVVRAYFDDLEAARAATAELDVWEFRARDGYLVTAVEPSGVAALEALGFRVEIDEGQTKAHQRFVDHLDAPNGIPGYACYRTVEETFASAAQIAAAHPNLARWIDAGDSWEKVTPGGLPGYDMMVLRLSNFGTPVHPDAKPKLFVTSAIHAREYTTAELSMRFAEWLIDNYDRDANATWLLDHHDIHLMLHANPDGRKQAETGLSWRKNTNQNYCGATSTSRGADLNRNFPFQWGCCGGSSTSPCALTYRGPSAASEPETQAIVAYGRAIFPDQRADPLTSPAPIDATGVYIDVHSYSELVLWAWGFTTAVAPNGVAMQTLGRKMAYFNGYEPDQAIGLYATDGSTDDFFYGDLGVAAYTFELGTAFFEGCSQFENTILPANLEALLYAAKVVRTPYLTPGGPDALGVVATPPVAAPGEPIVLTAVIDDTRFENRNGVEPTQNIAAAEYYIDTPPWSGGTPLPMVASDGSFNAKVERVQATIDTTNLSSGRHIIFVRGQDVGGSWGAFNAAFLYIVDPATAPVVEGYVWETGAPAPLQATVSTLSSLIAYTDAAGHYSMRIPSGTFNLTASAPNYRSQTVAVTAVNGQTITQNFSLAPVCTVWSDNVENGNQGWTAQAPWAITAEDAFSPTRSWTDSPGGQYANGRNISLTSRVFDLSGYTDVQIGFANKCDTEAGYDYCILEVSANGGTSWSEVWRASGSDTTWDPVQVSASALDGSANARLRFRFTSDSSVVADGWHLDDIVILAGGPACSTLPPTAVQLGNLSAETAAVQWGWLLLPFLLLGALAARRALRPRP